MSNASESKIPFDQKEFTYHSINRAFICFKEFGKFFKT